MCPFLEQNSIGRNMNRGASASGRWGLPGPPAASWHDLCLTAASLATCTAEMSASAHFWCASERSLAIPLSSVEDKASRRPFTASRLNAASVGPVCPYLLPPR